jgi:hypothetical protein
LTMMILEEDVSHIDIYIYRHMYIYINNYPEVYIYAESCIYIYKQINIYYIYIMIVGSSSITFEDQ